MVYSSKSEFYATSQTQKDMDCQHFHEQRQGLPLVKWYTEGRGVRETVWPVSGMLFHQNDNVLDTILTELDDENHWIQWIGFNWN